MTDTPPDFTLSSASVGDVLALDRWLPQTPGSVWLREGSTGLMGIPRSVRYQEGAGAGGRRLGSRAKVRPILLKLAVYGGLDAQRDTIDRLRRIVLADDATLTATIGGESWRLGIVYDSGLEGDYALDNANSRLTLIDLAMTAPQPYWEASETDTLILRTPERSEAFLSSWSSMPLSGDSGSLAGATVDNDSDAASPVTWTLDGPSSTAAASIGGRGWRTAAVTTDGQTLRLTPAWRGMPSVLLDGKPAWGMLASGARFPSLQPGRNTVSMSVQGAQPPVRTVSDSILAENWASNPRLSFDRSAYASGGWDVMLDGITPIPTGSGTRVAARTPGGRGLMGTVLNDHAVPTTGDVALLTTESRMEDTGDGLLIHYGGHYGWACMSMFPSSRVDWAKSVRGDWPASIRICVDLSFPSQMHATAFCCSRVTDSSGGTQWDSGVGDAVLKPGVNVLDCRLPKQQDSIGNIGLKLYFQGGSADVLVRSVMLTQDYDLTDTVHAADSTRLMLADGTRWDIHPGSATDVGYVDCVDPGSRSMHTCTWSSTRSAWVGAGVVSAGMQAAEGSGMTADEYDSAGRLLASSTADGANAGRLMTAFTPQDGTARIETTAWGAQPRRVQRPSVITGTDDGWFDGYTDTDTGKAEWRDAAGDVTGTPGVRDHACLHPKELTGGTTLTLEWTRLKETIR